MAMKESLLETLADALPLDLKLLFYHISTPPIPTSALFSAPPGQSEEKTFCENHFLAVSLPAKQASEEELLVFAIEVLVFTTRSLTTIFVSKADSTGYLHLLNIRPSSPSIVRAISTKFLSYLVKNGLYAPRLVLSLFARSQSQYLFPGSYLNPGKHVLDDRQLIRWWSRTVNPILAEYEPSMLNHCPNDGLSISSEAYMIIPGCDRFETRAFFPPSAKSERISRWSNSYPRDFIVPDGSAPPRCLIPRFPDDPKARFLEGLDSEISGPEGFSIGEWRSVKSLDQFWEMMAYRQECSAGRLVGFIWVVFTAPQQGQQPNMSSMHVLPDEGKLGQAVEQLPTPDQFQMNRLDLVLHTGPLDKDTVGPNRAASPSRTSALLKSINEPDELGFGEQRSTSQQHGDGDQATYSKCDNQKPGGHFYDEDMTVPVRWPSASRGQLLLPGSTYQLLISHLLESDFATEELTAKSTLSWITRASELTGISNWGQTVTGRKTVVPLVQSNGVQSKTTVNVLTGIRKKRKVLDDGGDRMEVTAAQKGEVAPTPESTPLPTDPTGKKRRIGES